jgi:alkylation response protein AidB-like acyl-CoA dehydrogenase
VLVLGAGLAGLTVPQELGGRGLTHVEVAAAFEELGRALACVPSFSTVALATNLLLASGDPRVQGERLPGIARGETVATVALTEEGGRWDEDGVRLRASPSRRRAGAASGESGDLYALDGHKTFVPDGHTAALLLVVARTDAGVSMFEVEGDAPGLARTPLPTVDQTRKQARLDLDETPGRLVGVDGGGWPVVSRMLDLAAVALAAEQLGGGQRCLEMSVDHAKTRVQFGRAIGSFQAIKHTCAEVLMEVEAARSATYFATWAAAEGDAQLPALASMAKAYCSEMYFRAAAETIQIHGGLGFTWDHDAHLYFKRAKSSEVLLGDPAYHRELLARRIGL